MTIEEAVEVILGKQAWNKCRFCNGMGYYQRDGGLMDCDDCQCFGYLLDKDYEDASNVLDRPLPPRPPVGIKFASSENIVMSVINPTALKKLTFYD